MTQPAKAQEPSMEEILASIRRIIADDEAKPPAAEKPAAAATPAKPAAPPPAKPAMKEAPPPPAPAPPPAAAKAPAPPPKPAPAPAPPPAPAASNNQDDIDALLNGLDEATTPEEIRPPLPDADVFELTDEMAVAPPPEPPQPAFRKVDPQDDVEFAESAAARHRQPAFEPPALESSSPSRPILSRSTVSAVEFGVQLPCQYRAQQQRADAGRPGQGNAAADAEILARRQSAGAGGAHRQGGNRAGFPRTVTGP